MLIRWCTLVWSGYASASQYVLYVWSEQTYTGNASAALDCVLYRMRCFSVRTRNSFFFRNMELLVWTSPKCNTWRSRVSSPRYSPNPVDVRVDVADSGSSSSCSRYPRMEPNTELARFRLPRDSVDRGVPGTGVSAIVKPSSDCLSAFCDVSEMVDMKDAVRRFRSRFEGCDSSLLVVVCRPVSAVSPPRPKMLLRLSLDMPRVEVDDAPPQHELSGAEVACEKLRVVATGSRQESHGPQNGRECTLRVRTSSWSNVPLGQWHRRCVVSDGGRTWDSVRYIQRTRSCTSISGLGVRRDQGSRKYVVIGA
jgi:hypothetical protein